ncbi:glycosyltransferase [Ancylomarina sp. YFZ004]
MSTPLVSINCITYNQENYIAQTLEGFLMQETTFPIEIIVCEDASTDNTAKIIQEYADKHPDLIIPLIQKTNQYSQGISPGLEIVMPRCKGKYIALCEGDDYWTDPYKLQKQVDFLEANPEYTFTFHDYEILDENSGTKSLGIGNRKIDELVDLESIILKKNIATASVMHRNILTKQILPDWVLKITQGDYGLIILLAERGFGKYLSDVMSVYRIHGGGVWSGNNISYRNEEDIKFFNYLRDYFSDPNLRLTIDKRLNNCFLSKSYIKISKGEFVSGLSIFLRYINSVNEKKMQNELKKILGAFKSGLLCLVRKLFSYFHSDLKYKNPIV